MPQPMLTHVEFTPDIEREFQSDPQLKNAIDRANERLIDVVGDSIDSVSVRWGLKRDKTNRRLIELTLSEATDSHTTCFVEDEFEREWHLRWRLYALWGDVLQDRSHRQLQELREAVQQLEGEEGASTDQQ